MFLAFIQPIVIALISTIVLELLVWRVLVLFSEKYDLNYVWQSIIAINIATNPAFNIISSMIDPARQFIYLELGFEVIIFIVEAGLLYLIYRKSFGKLFVLSFAMNLFSYGVGLLIYPPVWF